MIACQNDFETTGAADMLDKLEVQLSVEDGAGAIVIVKAALCWDRDEEAVGLMDEGVGRVSLGLVKEWERPRKSEHRQQRQERGGEERGEKVRVSEIMSEQRRDKVRIEGEV